MYSQIYTYKYTYKYTYTKCPCDALQRAATRCNTAAHCKTLQHTDTLDYAARRYNMLPQAATSCNTLQHTATHYNTLQHTATHCNTLQHTATLQHTVTRCNEGGDRWSDQEVFRRRELRGFVATHDARAQDKACFICGAVLRLTSCLSSGRGEWSVAQPDDG